jgi:hypothetical protein
MRRDVATTRAGGGVALPHACAGAVTFTGDSAATHPYAGARKAGANKEADPWIR